MIPVGVKHSLGRRRVGGVGRRRSSAFAPRDDVEHAAFGRSVVLVMGASFFAYQFGVVVHEIGHFVVGGIAEVPINGIVLHPFDLSYNDYGDLSGVSELRLAAESAGGALLNLVVAVSVGLLAWRWRSAALLPLVMWGALAPIQEGVGMIIGLVDYPDVGSDWVVVMEAGVPPVVIGLAAALLLVVGSAWMLLLVPLAGVEVGDGYWRKVAIFGAGIPLLMLSAVAYLGVAGSHSSIPGMAEQNRSIALGASVLLVMTLMAFHRWLAARLERFSPVDVATVRWRDALAAAALGAGVVVFMLAFFN